jgi:hypothetical protein
LRELTNPSSSCEVLVATSPASTTGGTGTTARRLLGRPAFDVGLEPDLDPSVAKIEDRPWHVRISVLVDAHGVAVGKPKSIGYAVGIDEIVDVDSLTHAV